MIYVGIDWARKHHFVVVLDEDGTTLYEQSVAHSARTLVELAESIAQLQPDPTQVRVAFEMHDGALLVWLIMQGYSIFPLSPKSADRIRDRYSASGAKSDRADAFALADTLRTDNGVLRGFKPPSGRAQELLELLRIRGELVDERTAKIQRLRGSLDEWSPELSALCKDLKCQWVWRLLAAFPLQQKLAGMELAEVEKACERKLHESTRKRLKAALTADCLPVPCGRREALAWQVRALVEAIARLSEQIREIEARLLTAVNAHPRARLAWSLPVRGIVSCATLLAALEMADAASWRELVALWGVAPVTKQSGKKRSVRRRRGCDHFICQALTQFAHCTAQVEGCWAREMYYDKREAGGEHYTILRQIALRWVKVLCAMWRDNTLYDEQRRQNDRRQMAA
jgi:transposase